MNGRRRQAVAAEYTRTVIAPLRAAWLAENGPCRRCGSWDDLQIDHVDPTVKSGSPWEYGRSVEWRDAELAKCQPLCVICHVQKTLADMGGPPTSIGRGGDFRRFSVGWCAQKRAEQRATGELLHRGGAR